MLRLVLAATFLGAVSALSFMPHDVDTARVEWTNADETNPIYPPISPEPDYDGDGTFTPEDGDGTGGDGGNGNGTGDGNDAEGDGGGTGEGTGPAGGDAGEPGVDEPGRRTESEAGGGGLLGLSLPVQAAASVGLIALAFLALLPGRRMPEHLR